MSGEHFRKRAAAARAMAETGTDPHLSLMLLELAKDLEAEAELIEAGLHGERRRAPRVRPVNATAALRLAGAADPIAILALIDVSRCGAHLHGAARIPDGAEIVLDLPAQGITLPCRIVGAEGPDIRVAFATDPATQALAQRAMSGFEAAPDAKPVG